MITEDQISQMVILKRQFRTNQEIGKALKISSTSVGSYLKQFMSDYDAYKRVKISEDDIIKMIFLKKQCKKNIDIGEELGTSVVTVGYYLKRFMPDYDKYKRPGITRQEVNKMIGMKREGKLNREIGQELGRSTTLVGKYLQRSMPDYDKYKNVRISQPKIAEMIELKRRYKKKSIYRRDIRNKWEVGRLLPQKVHA